jgi:hypothetical protein
VEIRRKAEQDAQKKAAEQWLRLRIGEENARRLANKREWDRQEALQKIEGKASSVDAMLQQRRLEDEAKKKKSDDLAEKKRQLMEQFAAAMERKAQPDLEGLARRFGLDFEEISRRIDNGDRQPIAAELPPGAKA